MVKYEYAGITRLPLTTPYNQISYPLPHVDDLFASLSGGRYFSKLDLSKAYLQIELEEESKPHIQGSIPIQPVTLWHLLNPCHLSKVYENTIAGLQGGLSVLRRYCHLRATAEEHLQNLDKALSILETGALRHGTRKIFHKQMHVYISVHNSCSLQHTELKINIEIQQGSLYLTTNLVAMETIVMGMSNNYSVKIVNFFKRGALNRRGGL